MLRCCREAATPESLTYYTHLGSPVNFSIEKTANSCKNKPCHGIYFVIFSVITALPGYAPN